MMDRNTLIQLAQQKVLNQYALLVDCSELDDTVLERIARRLPAVNENDALTFASWCNQVFGEGIRVPVVRYGYDVAGQTHMSSLSDELGLVKNLRQQKKEHRAATTALKQEIARLKAEHAITLAVAIAEKSSGPPPKILSELSVRLRDWYWGISHGLQKLLPDINEVKGHIFEYQGASNRDYRTRLVDLIFLSLQQLESLGFEVVAEQQVAIQKDKITPNITIYRTNPVGREGNACESFSFTIREMPTDILMLANQHTGQDDPITPIPRQPFHVSVAGEWSDAEQGVEVSHLSYVLQKLFLALAKSADNVPRGVLREKILLCLMLCWTAPCMPAQKRGQYISLMNCGYRAKAIRDETLDIPAGTVIQHLFTVAEANFNR